VLGQLDLSLLLVGVLELELAGGAGERCQEAAHDA
jgi:hypothetical protein